MRRMEILNRVSDDLDILLNRRDFTYNGLERHHDYILVGLPLVKDALKTVRKSTVPRAQSLGNSPDGISADRGPILSKLSNKANIEYDLQTMRQ